MEKLTLLALIVIGTISSCEGCSPYTKVLRRKSSGVYGCGKERESIDVIFYDFKVKGNDTEVVYTRLEADYSLRRFATNGSVDDHVLPCQAFVDCAKAAALAGFDAFRLSTSQDWFGYKLFRPYLKCGVPNSSYIRENIYVRKEFLVKEPTVVPFDKAPYVVLEDGTVRQYMLSAYVQTDPEPRVVTGTPEAQDLQSDHRVSVGLDSYFVKLITIDLNSCLNAGAYGLLMDVATSLYDATLSVTYFFNECGNTVKISAESPKFLPQLIIYSHHGFGCTYYPNNLPDECTVTFETENSTPTFIRFYSATFDPDNACEGLNMTIIGSPGQGNEETKNTCDPSGEVVVNGHLKYTFTLLSHPSKRAVGFHAEINRT